MDSKTTKKTGKITLVLLALTVGCAIRSYTLSSTAGLDDYKKAYSACMIQNNDLKAEIVEAMDIITNLLNCPKGE